MKTVVIGRETPVGRSLVDLLRDEHAAGDVVAVASDPGRDGATWQSAFTGARAIIDVADAAGVPCAHDIHLAVETATRAALDAAATTAVEHFVFVSSLGLVRASEHEHFSARLAAEVLVQAASMPHTIVRTTQLFESVRTVVQAGLHGDPAHRRMVIQPIAARDVAVEVSAIVGGPPGRPVIALAGPEQFHLDELVQRYRLARFHHREEWADVSPVVVAPDPTDPSARLRGGTATLTSTRFRDWAATAP